MGFTTKRLERNLTDDVQNWQRSASNCERTTPSRNCVKKQLFLAAHVLSEGMIKIVVSGCERVDFDDERTDCIASGAIAAAALCNRDLRTDWQY